MIKIDLVTGLLGSGKTTFIKNYINYLKSKNNKICIIVNDYGAVNVDTMILNTLGVDIESIASGCDYDCHIRRFKTKLITIIMKHYDYVIVEPSGIFDTDEFFDLMYEDIIESNYEINNVFCLYDINNINLSKEEEYFFVSQSSSARKIIVTKRDNRNMSINLDYLNSIYKKFKSNRILKESDILYNDSIDYTSLNLGYCNYDHIKLQLINQNSFESVYILDKDINKTRLKSIVNELFKNDIYGNIIRVKGFIYDTEFFEVNITKDNYLCQTIDNGQKVLIVIGYNLNKDLIIKLFS